MKNQNLIRFVQSLVLLPAMSMSVAFGGLHNVDISQNTLVQKLNINSNRTLAIQEASELEAKILKDKAEAIDTYFADRDMPLEGTGLKMVQEAEKNGLDWRLLPAIAVRESTGGKFACKKVPNSAFGWGSCKISFKSHEQAIEIVAKNLGGNNPNTAYHYEDKDTLEILRAYNPPSIVPKYAEQVMSIMDAIGPKDVTNTLAVNS